jgi:hypothetical protein
MIPPLRLLLLSTLALLLSCAVEVGPPHEEMAPDYETQPDPSYPSPAAPTTNAPADREPVTNTEKVWVGGYWATGPWGWTWVPGRWVALPRPGAVRSADRFCRPWGF